MLEQWLTEKLHDRKEKGLFRSLQTENDLVDFTSNDYLGLARNESLYNNIREAVQQLPKRNGSTGSRLLSGNTAAADSLEQKLATLFQSPSSLLFNSGYTANLAVLSSIPQKNDTILYDELAHASLKDGARLSLARKFSFRHNDLSDLTKKAARSSGRIFVVVESVYSMDGDECPLEDLIALSEKSGFTIILDEAHTTGVRGPRGSGLAVEKKLHDRVPVRIYTFGKAMGVCGACVAGSDNFIRYLVNYARPFIYTTAPSPYLVTSIGCSFDFLGTNLHLQQTLRSKVDRFLDHTRTLQSRTPSKSPIQTFIVPGSANTRRIAGELQQRGFDVRAIVAPTVPEGKERLRICLHTFNTDNDIDALGKLLEEIESAT